MSQLELARAELQRSNEQLACFAGQVSHDLLNPLTAVSMSLRLVGEQLEDPAAVDAAQLGWLVTRAVSGAERMESLIEELLSFARLGGRLAREPVDLADGASPRSARTSPSPVRRVAHGRGTLPGGDG